MKIINKYICEEIKGPVILSIFIFTFIFLLDIMVAMMENIIVKGISLIDIFRLLSFYIPPILTQTIPLGLFLGIMICFSKFTRNSESVAMVSLGLSIKEILKPIITIAFLSSIFIFFLQESIIPRSVVKLKYLGAKIAYENPIFNLKEKALITNLDKYSIYIDKVNSDGVANDIIIFENGEADKNNNFPTILTAKNAFWKDSTLILKNSKFVNFSNNGENITGTFSEKKVSLTAFFQDFSVKIKDVESLSIKNLIKEIKTLKDKEEKIKYKTEIFRKLSLVFSTFPLAILGVIFAIGHHRNSRKHTFLFGMIVAFIYIILLNTGIVLANSGKINSFIGTWFPNILLYLLSYKMYRNKKLRGI